MNKGWEVSDSELLNHVINGALGHHTDSAAGGGGAAVWGKLETNGLTAHTKWLLK